MFADRYIERSGRSGLIATPVDKETGIIVVIPCKNEPEILKTLDSINSCHLPRCNVEVIIVINHSEIDSEEIKKNNRITEKLIKDWIDTVKREKISYFPIGPLEFKKKWAGAGLARKRGMDEAVFRFNALDKPEGVIVSLDADTVTEKNYLTEIENYYSLNRDHIGATINFTHQRDGLSERHRKGIDLYEDYMTYYKSALSYIGYPFPMFTVGSAFSVKANAYVRRGGMTRRKAGEDFYFLQNLAYLGTVGEIESTTVYPSARLSDRVPFGTGPILSRWMQGEEDLTITYDIDAFTDLKLLFDKSQDLYQTSEESYLTLLQQLSTPLSLFLTDDNFWSEIVNLNRNCATLSTFQKRFYQKFNAFKILKYLNFSHINHYRRASLYDQIEKLNSLINKK